MVKHTGNIQDTGYQSRKIVSEKSKNLYAQFFIAPPLHREGGHYPELRITHRLVSWDLALQGSKPHSKQHPTLFTSPNATQEFHIDFTARGKLKHESQYLPFIVSVEELLSIDLAIVNCMI